MIEAFMSELEFNIMLIATIIGCTLLAIVCLGGARILFGIVAFVVIGIFLFLAAGGVMEVASNVKAPTFAKSAQKQTMKEWCPDCIP